MVKCKLSVQDGHFGSHTRLGCQMTVEQHAQRTYIVVDGHADRLTEGQVDGQRDTRPLVNTSMGTHGSRPSSAQLVLP